MPDANLVETVNSVDIWWVARPPAPRLTVRQAGIATLVVVGLTTGVTLGSISAGFDVDQLWPWARNATSGWHVALRYLFVLLVVEVYVVGRSAWAWRRSIRTARTDLEAAGQLVHHRRWLDAAVRLHRHAVLWQHVWRRLPPEAIELDRRLRPHLPGRPRLYLYYRGERPSLPETPEAGFTPRAVPAAITRWWTAPLLVLLSVVAYVELTGVFRTPQWQLLRLANFLALATVLGAYVYLYAMALLGRGQYLRFSPGQVEVVSHGFLARRSRVETVRLRQGHSALDIAESAMVLVAMPRRDQKRGRRFVLRSRPELIETALRAILSTAQLRVIDTSDRRP